MRKGFWTAWTEPEAWICTACFSKWGPHKKLESSSTMLKAVMMLRGIRKPIRNRLKQNFQVAYQAWLLHCSICDQNILLNGMQPSTWEDENHNKHKRAKASHFSPGSGFTILICCFSIPIRFPLPSLSLSLNLSLSLLPCLFFSPPSRSLSPSSFLLTPSKHNTHNYRAHLSQRCHFSAKTTAFGCMGFY